MVPAFLDWLGLIAVLVLSGVVVKLLHDLEES